jgi:hypothetical protein
VEWSGRGDSSVAGRGKGLVLMVEPMRFSEWIRLDGV